MNSLSPREQLTDIKTDVEVEAFVNKWCEEKRDLHLELSKAMASKEVSLSELMHRSGINRNYGYNIVNGRRKNPSRDKVLALCIAMRLTVSEAQELLAVANVRELYFRDERDVRIAAAMNNGIADVLELNILLESKGVLPLEI